MYKDIADAVESLKEKGFTHTYQLDGEFISCTDHEGQYDADEVNIVESHIFDSGTDPGSESTVYALESHNGVKGILVIAFGVYANPNKAELIDRLLQKSQ